MTTNSIPSPRRLLLVRSAPADAARVSGPRRYRLARLDLGPRGRDGILAGEDRFTYLKRTYD